MRIETKLLCDDIDRLECFLNGELSESDIQVVEDHLAGCPACREQLDRFTASGDDWQTCRHLLNRDEYDRDSHNGTKSKSTEAAMLSREIRGWLDPTDDPQMLGRFAGYEIVGIVGHGGMGIVLKGFEASLNRFVAIKILAPRLATNATARKRFAREAQAAAAVLHENVIAIHRVDEWHGLPFLVMPYVGGDSLQKRIDQEGPLNIEAAVRIGLQITAGLKAAHEQGLVHRDIKPANILLDKGVERVTITDFGLARAADDASMTRTGVVAGTPQYMSPEQAEARAVDARSDLFSLGSVLYTMATGRPPFRGEGSFEVLKRIGSEPAKKLREIDATIPVWFERLVARLHAKAANDRPQSAREVHSLLNACLLHLTQPEQSLPSELLQTPVARRPRWIAGGIGVAVAGTALVWIIGSLFTQPSAQDESETAVSQAAAAQDETKVKKIATVLDKPIHKGDLNKNVDLSDNLWRLVIQPLEIHYCKQHVGLDPEEELTKKIKDKASRALSIDFVRRARLQKHLYEKYGGRVLLTSFGPIAFDGRRKWFGERERAGDFEITDPQLKEALANTLSKVGAGLLTTSPSQIKAAFDPTVERELVERLASVPAGAFSDPKLKLVGIAFGSPIHLDQRHMKDPAALTSTLHHIIVSRLEEHYRKQHPEVEPTNAEIDALAVLNAPNDAAAKAGYRRRIEELRRQLKTVDAGSDEFLELQSQIDVVERKLERGGGRALADFLARPMKFQKHLYDNYGGGRGLRTPQGVDAFDAQMKWVEERERLGEFQIADSVLRKAFYDYWSNGKETFGDKLFAPTQQSSLFQYSWVESVKPNEPSLPEEKEKPKPLPVERSKLSPDMAGRDVVMTFKVAKSFPIRGSVPVGRTPTFGLTPAADEVSPKLTVLVSGDAAEVMLRLRYHPVSPADNDQLKGAVVEAHGVLKVFRNGGSYQLNIRDWDGLRLKSVKRVRE